MAKRKPASTARLVVSVAGHFQVGKSTLVNCLLRERVAKCGDSTTPTTARAQPYPCGQLTLLDTPGINAEEAHTWEMWKGIQRSDLAILVVSSLKELSEPLKNLLAQIARERLPLYALVNCWDDKTWNDGDPDAAKDKQVVKAIISQIRERSKLIGSSIVNLEWAAAARGCLDDEERAEKLITEYHSGDKDAPSSLDVRSGLLELEKFLFPDPLPAFSPAGLECIVLTSKFIRRLGKES